MLGERRGPVPLAQPSEGTNPDNTLILNFWPQNWETNVCVQAIECGALLLPPSIPRGTLGTTVILSL